MYRHRSFQSQAVTKKSSLWTCLNHTNWDGFTLQMKLRGITRMMTAGSRSSMGCTIWPSSFMITLKRMQHFANRLRKLQVVIFHTGLTLCRKNLNVRLTPIQTSTGGIALWVDTCTFHQWFQIPHGTRLRSCFHGGKMLASESGNWQKRHGS